jgi:hypothetical protein
MFQSRALVFELIVNRILFSLVHTDWLEADIIDPEGIRRAFTARAW